MLPIHRPQLIQDLSDTALGLIEESESTDPQDARALIELAGTLDRLRVQMLAEMSVAPQITPHATWTQEKHH